MTLYIAPNSKIYILKNVPLDPTYDHTIYWANADGDDAQHTTSKAAQAAYFSSKVKYTLANQSYQRLQRGWMRIEVLSDNLYDCNYLMFQNTSFGSKWFYAFIKKVEYINNKVSEIEFEIDEMQTWWFDYELDECFVEREHSLNDNIFQNLVEENLDIGDEYVCKNKETFSLNEQAMLIYTNVTTTKDPVPATRPVVSPSVINNIYMGTLVSAGLTFNNLDAIQNVITNWNKPEEVISISQYPAVLGDQTQQTPKTLTKVLTPNLGALDGHLPRNNKLYSYPYNMLLLSNNSGQVAQYRWEDWNSNDAIHSPSDPVTFEIRGSIVSIPAVICYPTYYRGIEKAYDDGLIISNFPQCAWEGDTFKAWLAQNSGSVATGAIVGSATGVAQMGLGIGMMAAGIAGTPATAGASNMLTTMGAGTFIGGTSTTLSAVLGTVGKLVDAKAVPNQTYGQTHTESLNTAIGRLQFDFYYLTIKRQYAEIIDSFFDRFGYACKRTKVPNRNARRHWTYTKTTGCTITGSIPADTARKICEIYNAGITFWVHPEEVGDYSLAEYNTPYSD